MSETMPTTTTQDAAAAQGMPENRILQVRGLKKFFPITSSFLKRTIGHVRAVDDVDININRGETFGLVGESGCGKTTIGRCILRAINATDGEVHFRTSDDRVVDVNSLKGSELRRVRRDMQMVFQDPYSSLNPRLTVLGIIAEPLICHKVADGDELRRRVMDLMEMVGLDKRQLERYPHAFSGGQRQRIGIARALATNPSFIVCDEAVSALDVSVQSQIINLLMDLQRQLNLSYLFISHDLSVIRHISDRVGVMYVGRLVERADTLDLYSKPMHPYTQALLSAIPQPDPTIKTQRILLEGEVANPAHLPQGCHFHPRCRYATEKCRELYPEMRELEPRHFVACHRAEELREEIPPEA